MFKRIEIWILYLAILLVLPFTIGFGFLVRQEILGTKKLGKISQTALFLAEIPVNMKKILDENFRNGNGLFVEETNYGRTLYFNPDKSLKWSHVNRAENSKVSLVGWSRILYTKSDILNVNNFLNKRGQCNE